MRPTTKISLDFLFVMFQSSSIKLYLYSNNSQQQLPQTIYTVRQRHNSITENPNNQVTAYSNHLAVAF